MNEDIVRKIFETIAKILSERGDVEITITDVKRKDVQNDN